MPSFHKLVLPLFLLGFSLFALSSEIEYVIVTNNGLKAGYQTVKRTGNKVEVEFDFKENGRGPTLKELITLAPDGTMKDYHVSGTSEMGVPSA